MTTLLELPQADFDRIKPLFDTTQTNSPMIFSTLDGHTLGRAFVDDLTQPTSCLLVSGFQNFTFTHATVDPQWLAETITAVRPSMRLFLNWSPTMAAKMQPPAGYDRIFSGTEFMAYNEQGTLDLPPNRQLRRMDMELCERIEWRHLMLEGFGSAENFLAKGFGMCVMDGDNICSEAYAVFLGAGKYEVGIVTNEKYRMQGNAYLACKGLLELVKERGLPPHWSYFENNEGSAATARKLGFGAPRNYQWFYYAQG